LFVVATQRRCPAVELVVFGYCTGQEMESTEA
jgi:hypothetical protein